MDMTSTKISLNLALVLGLAMVGCGDDSTPATDSGTPTDTGVADGGTSGGGIADTGTADTGTPDSGTMTADFAAAQTAILEGGCACFFADQGYADAAACVADNTPVAAVRTCNADTLAANPGVQPFFDCLAAALVAQKACYDAAACDGAAIGTCNTTSSDAQDACPAPDMTAGQAYVDALNTCIVGDPGSCPDTTASINTLGDAVFTGSTVGSGNDIETDCGNGGSADMVVQWAAPADGSYEIDTIGSNFDTLLQVQDACDSTAFLACNDDAGAGDIGLRSRLTVGPLTAGQVVLIVIEGYSASDAGDYIVNIHDAPATTMDGGTSGGGIADAGTAG